VGRRIPDRMSTKPLRLISMDGRVDIPLEQDVVVVGRDRRCDVWIGSFQVSRRHCCLTLYRDGVLVRDLASTNGTRINGRRVESGFLRAGDELWIGFCRYLLEVSPVPDREPGLRLTAKPENTARRRSPSPEINSVPTSESGRPDQGPAREAGPDAGSQIDGFGTSLGGPSDEHS
jgi:predicted component of type VI protein secretion system